MELTEIIVATKSPDTMDFLSSKSQKAVSYENGKTFGEYLAGYSSEQSDFESKKAADSENEISSNVPLSEKTQERVAEKTSEPEKKLSDKNEKVSETEKDEEKSDNQVYYSLNLMKEENSRAGSVEAGSLVKEMGAVSDSILERISSMDDESRAEMLTSFKEIKIDEDFEFEDVSDDLLALENAQSLSVSDPESFLNEIKVSPSLEDEISFASDKNQKTESDFDRLKSKITVTDLRTQTEKPENTVFEDKNTEKVKVTMTGNDSATIEMNLGQNQQNAVSNVLTSNAQVSSSDGSTFQAMLNNQIQANASEIVKTGNIILKDNNKGTINLVLHPDDLGNVRLTLSMDGDKVTGHIAVNTKEAMEVFKNNAETLREAFIKNGFENASFDVSFGNGSFGDGQYKQAENQRDQNSFFARREYGSLNEVIDASSEGISEEINDFRKNGINIVA